MPYFYLLNDQRQLKRTLNRVVLFVNVKKLLTRHSGEAIHLREWRWIWGPTVRKFKNGGKGFGRNFAGDRSIKLGLARRLMLGASTWRLSLPTFGTHPHTRTQTSILSRFYSIPFLFLFLLFIFPLLRPSIPPLSKIFFLIPLVLFFEILMEILLRFYYPIFFLVCLLRGLGFRGMSFILIYVAVSGFWFLIRCLFGYCCRGNKIQHMDY